MSFTHVNNSAIYDFTQNIYFPYFVPAKLFRGNEILFRGNEILFRGNEILFRGNEILFQGNEILFRARGRNIISSEGTKYYFERGNKILFRGNEISFRENEISFRENEIIFRGNEIRNLTILSLYKATLGCSP